MINIVFWLPAAHFIRHLQWISSLSVQGVCLAHNVLFLMSPRCWNHLLKNDGPQQFQRCRKDLVPFVFSILSRNVYTERRRELAQELWTMYIISLFPKSVLHRCWTTVLERSTSQFAVQMRQHMYLILPRNSNFLRQVEAKAPSCCIKQNFKSV